VFLVGCKRVYREQTERSFWRQLRRGKLKDVFQRRRIRLHVDRIEELVGSAVVSFKWDDVVSAEIRNDLLLIRARGGRVIPVPARGFQNEQAFLGLVRKLNELKSLSTGMGTEPAGRTPTDE
jgi:hypothetical protein